MARAAGPPQVDESESYSKIVTIQVDSSVLSQHRISETDFYSHMEIDPAKQAQAKETETTMRRRMPRTISTVRAQLQCVDDGIYAPHSVPIGPYHLNRSSPWIEKEKMRSVSFLQSLSEQHMKASLSGLMEDLQPLARECYADGARDMTAEQFSSILLNDGCYLLLFFVDYVSSSSNGSLQGGDELSAAPVSRNTMVRDIVFLVENQIPLFVLQMLHERVTGVSSSVLDYIAGPVQELLQKQLFISRKPRPAPPTCSHLLHLVHTYIQPTQLPALSNTSRHRRHRRLTGRWRRATEYQRYANVWFKPRELVEDEESSVLDVQLRRGTLWMPRLRVDSNTWTVLRNLMAFEERAHRRPVTAYCVFMSQLACTAEDVELLRGAGIVDHFLSNDEEVARGFANLCTGVVMDVDDLGRNYLKPLWHELENRCHSRAQRYIGWFRHGQNVRIAAAFLAAVILLVCQVIQTFYAAAGRGQGRR